MKIAIVGSGYVGLVIGACFAHVGHQVICIDKDERKVEMLQRGEVPIYEPGLEQLVRRNVSANRLFFCDSIKLGVDNSEVIFIAVPTPPNVDGSVDLTYIERVAREIAEVLTEYRVIVDKSTVPVKTGEEVAVRFVGIIRSALNSMWSVTRNFSVKVAQWPTLWSPTES